MRHPVYELMRTDVLRSTKPVSPFNSADVVVLVQLALCGAWTMGPERLFFHRRNPESTIIKLTPHRLAEW